MHIYVMSLSTKMWLKLFEILLQVVSSQDQPNVFTFTRINTIVHLDYFMVKALFVGGVFTMCVVFAILLVTMV
jgi:type III secretory pathway component EscU